MSKWHEYEKRKKVLQEKLSKRQITHEEYQRLIEKLCKELNI